MDTKIVTYWDCQRCGRDAAGVIHTSPSCVKHYIPLPRSCTGPRTIARNRIAKIKAIIERSVSIESHSLDSGFSAQPIEDRAAFLQFILRDLPRSIRMTNQISLGRYAYTFRYHSNHWINVVSEEPA